MSEKKVVRQVHVGKSPKSGKMRWAIMCLGAENQKVWYSTFEPSIGREVEPLKEGDVIELDFYQKGDFFNIIKVTKLPGEAPITQDAPPEEEAEEKPDFFRVKQTLIVAQSCLDRAIKLLAYTDPEVPPQGFQTGDILAKVFLLADSMEQYIWKKVGESEKEDLATPNAE